MYEIEISQMVLRCLGAPEWLGWAGQLGFDHPGEEPVSQREAQHKENPRLKADEQSDEKLVKTRLGSWSHRAPRAQPTLELKSGFLMKRIERFGMHRIAVPQLVL